MKKLITLLALAGLLIFSTSTFATEENTNATGESTEMVDQSSDGDNSKAVTNSKSTKETKSSPKTGEQQAGGQQDPTGSIWTTVIFWVLLIVVIYFFMIRPASKRSKEARKFKESLKKGSKVITAGGIYGIIDEINETYVLLEIANGVRIKIDINSIASYTEAETANMDKDSKKNNSTMEKN